MSNSSIINLNDSLPPLIGNDRTDLAALFAPEQQPSFRTEQVFKWLYGKGIRDPRDFSNMPKPFRTHLAENFSESAVEVEYRTSSDVSQVVKYLFRLVDGKKVEGVWIPDRDRGTLCVSSQVGCALGCEYCATGSMGFTRNLTSGEIIDQLLTVRYRENKLITHVVFMGMGEPLQNYDAVAKIVRILNDPAGCAIARRHITISTAGWIPGIERLIADHLPCRLAISLGSPDDEIRAKLMPVAQRFPLTDLFAAAKAWTSEMDDHVTIEYTLLAGVNDRPEDAKKLNKMLMGIPSKINILTYNPGPDARFERSSGAQTERFTTLLEEIFCGPVTRRISRGDEIGAACGQLVLLKK